MLCVNCNTQELFGRQRFFCGPACQEFAKLIRWARRHGLHEIYEDADLCQAMFEKIRWVELGGYRSLHKVSPADRAAVIDRARGLCEECGSRGTQVDHVALVESETYNKPENLRLLCDGCHSIKTRKTRAANASIELEEPISKSPTVLGEFLRRVAADPPTRPCDDEETWEAFILEERAKRRYRTIWDELTADEKRGLLLAERKLRADRRKPRDDHEYGHRATDEAGHQSASNAD